jgi:hypothetical protein
MQKNEADCIEYMVIYFPILLKCILRGNVKKIKFHYINLINIIMPFVITEITDFKKGSQLNLVKTKIKEGKISKDEIGKRIMGVLAKDISLNKPIYI